MRVPGARRLEEYGRRFGMELGEDETRSYLGLMEATLASYRRLDELAEPALPVEYPRTSGYRPEAGDNPLGAWYVKCDVRGAESGPLAGKRVALKDNVCLAGVPMMNGTVALEGYVPEFDATIVTRILDAGGRIAGKAVCEHLCFSGGSHTSDTGPVRNPHDPSRSAGGSSSGSAALVAAGEVEMAIGGDQGGSIRMPASWCGVYGLKPTHGLVPYTGVFPIELTLDHTGPIAASVGDVALLLEAIAGPDGLDPRQRDVQVNDYTGSLEGGAEGLKVGVVPEGFGWPGLSESDVDEAVRAAAERLREAGAEVSEVSVPLHRDGIHIWNGIAIEGATELMVRGNSMGTNWEGHYATSLLDAYGRGRVMRADDLSETVKLTVLMGEHLRESYGGRYYAKAQNLARKLRAAYDAALGEYDLLLMPTLPMKATVIPEPDAPIEERVARALEMIANTAPFDVSGHPAISVPCALSDGLPVGFMLVGRRWDEATVLRAARAFEKTGAYKVEPVSPG
ncbi:amidase [Rubrobacter radiotolerans]|uniref:Amidase n=1 Tax=Rubrobacter radiotolerans TaxID=42256 RepID=A0AB35T4C7_RUBRA|nr:amidase [Rubrobacter radiotolerans]MDX5893645.1 amidase [Rubrobacter radiotolerans]